MMAQGKKLQSITSKLRGSEVHAKVTPERRGSSNNGTKAESAHYGTPTTQGYICTNDGFSTPFKLPAPADSDLATSTASYVSTFDNTYPIHYGDLNVSAPYTAAGAYASPESVTGRLTSSAFTSINNLPSGTVGGGYSQGFQPYNPMSPATPPHPTPPFQRLQQPVFRTLAKPSH